MGGVGVCGHKWARGGNDVSGGGGVLGAKMHEMSRTVTQGRGRGGLCWRGAGAGWGGSAEGLVGGGGIKSGGAKKRRSVRSR